MAETSPLKVWLDRDGALLRLRLARPKANIVDAEMIAALRLALGEASPTLRGVIGACRDSSRPASAISWTARLSSGATRAACWRSLPASPRSPVAR